MFALGDAIDFVADEWDVWRILPFHQGRVRRHLQSQNEIPSLLIPYESYTEMI